jgi:hypothetical protein
LIGIAPVNRRLMATQPEQANAASTALITQWGALHASARFSAGAVIFLLASRPF